MLLGPPAVGLAAELVGAGAAGVAGAAADEDPFRLRAGANLDDGALVAAEARGLAGAEAADVPP